jgi:hypothetical protein
MKEEFGIRAIFFKRQLVNGKSEFAYDTYSTPKYFRGHVRIYATVKLKQIVRDLTLVFEPDVSEVRQSA